MSTSNLDLLVSLQRTGRAGGVNWTACVAECRDGRVRIRRIGSDIIECDVTPSLFRTMLDRGLAVRGACKIWRLTTEELATLAVTVLADAGDSAAPIDAHGLAIKASLMNALCAISHSNVSVWAASFDLELGDVEDLVLTHEVLDQRMATLPPDRERSLRVLELIAKNVPDGAAWVRHEGWKDLIVAGEDRAARVRSGRARPLRASRPVPMERRGAA